MRVASDVKSSESPDSGSGATPNVFGKSAGSTKKKRGASLFWKLLSKSLHQVPRSGRRPGEVQPGLEDVHEQQVRFHLVNAAHPAINAQVCGPLTGTYSYLSKKLSGNPTKYGRFYAAAYPAFQLIYVVTSSIHFANPCLSKVFYVNGTCGKEA
jgi:hypothetical protein